MRLAHLAFILALTSCAAEVEHVSVTLPACESLTLTGDLSPAQCRLEAQGQTLNVAYESPPQGVHSGAVSIEVLGDNGAVVQTLREPDVSEYRPVSVQDIDGDGRADILVARATGNVNSEIALWVFIGEEGAYRRVGEVSGFAINRTAEGLVAVSARSSAVEWNVEFYQLGADALTPIATVTVTGSESSPGGEVAWSCRLSDAPSLERVSMTRESAETKFCAEPVAQVSTQ